VEICVNSRFPLGDFLVNINLKTSTAIRLNGAARFALALGILLVPALAHAEELAPTAESSEDGTEIVVTARHRDEDAQDVPIALSVVSAEALEKTGNFTLGQIQQLVPSLQVFSFNPRNTNINIRGLGSNVALTNDGLENGVGIYIDGVFYGRVGQTQFDLVDLQQVEVLRGPQGTLFGKNTTAGAINITSRLPSFEPELSGEATLGNYNYRQFRASVSAPLSDKIAFRLSGADTRRDGFIDNVRTGRDVHDYQNTNVRGQLLIKPSDPLTIRLIGDYSRQKQECCINVLVGAFTTFDNGAAVPNNILQRFARAGYTPQSFTPFARQTDADSPFHANMEAYGFSGQVDYDFGGAALTSITASRRWLWNPANDGDSVGLPVVTLAQQANRQKQFSQELRLASTGTRKIDYVVGLYYFYQIVKGYGASAYGAAAPDWFRGATNALPLATWNAALNGFKATSYSSPETHSYAAFGQTTWHISDALSLTTGLRFTHENKSGDYRQDQVAGPDITAFPGAQAIRNNFNPTLAFSTKRSDDSLSGTASLAYKITPQALAYISYSRGNKSGGLNLTAIPAGIDPTVRPEKVNAYEAGLKSQFLNRTVTLNLAAFWTDVSDYQSAITEQIPSTVTFRQYVTNIGKVRSKGGEVDLSWQPTKWVGLTASANYTDAKYRNYVNGQAPVESGLAVADLTGQPLSGVPKFTYALGGDVAQPVGSVEVYAHADFSHRSGYYTAASNSRYSLVPGYGLLNARIGVRSGNGVVDVSIWARNLLNKDYFQTLTPANTGLVTGLVGDPRTFGVTVRTKL
jgi:iron complex outermembrane receptor protein